MYRSGFAILFAVLLAIMAAGPVTAEVISWSVMIGAWLVVAIIVGRIIFCND